MKPKIRNRAGIAAALAGAALALSWYAPQGLQAGEPVTSSSKEITPPVQTTPSLEQGFLNWWNGKTASGNWFTLGPTLADYGLTIDATWKGNVYGNVVGGYQDAAAFNQEFKFKFLYDFSKVFHVDGLTVQSNWRYREGTNINNYVGANGFSPTTYYSNTGIRILSQYLEYQTKNGILDVSGGWVNPYDIYLQQPDSKLFENNSITSGKGIGNQSSLGGGIPIYNTALPSGIGGNPAGTRATTFKTGGVPWSSGYDAWGGTIKIKPIPSVYFTTGLYADFPSYAETYGTQWGPTSVYPYTNVPKSYLGQWEGSNQQYKNTVNGLPLAGPYVQQPRNNHGFGFAGSPANGVNTGNIRRKFVNPNTVTGPAPTNYQTSGYYNPGLVYGNNGSGSSNGLWWQSELGWTPKWGPDQLAGHYAIGYYLTSEQNSSFLPVAYPSGYQTVSTIAKKLPTVLNQTDYGLYFQVDQKLFSEHDRGTGRPNNAGLSTFNEVSFQPAYNNLMPFYFQSGLVYTGLIPGRKADQFGIAFGLGTYSSDYNQEISQVNQTQLTQQRSANGATTYYIGPNGTTSFLNPVVTKVGGKSVTTYVVTNYGSTNANGTTNNPSQVHSPNAPPSAQYPYSGAYIPQFTYTAVLEADYKIQLNKWAYIKPGIQFIINPYGDGLIKNSLVLQTSIGVTF